jgi:formiminotetrahydrofolate cyclodeaminase
MDSKLDFVDFTEELATTLTTPAGGAASSALGAMAAALGQKVCTITTGKPQYAEVQQEIDILSEMLDGKRCELLELYDADVKSTAPLFGVFSTPKESPHRTDTMQPILLEACEPQRKIMKTISELIDILQRLQGIGSKLAQTDVGVAASFARAALEGAALNIYVNASLLEDSEKANELCEEADGLVEIYTTRAERVVHDVSAKLRA